MPGMRRLRDLPRLADVFVFGAMIALSGGVGVEGMLSIFAGALCGLGLRHSSL